MNDHAHPACRPNIGPRQRRRRIVLGWIWATIAVAIGVFAVLVAPRSLGDGGPPVARAWRLAVFPPAWVAALCFLEARSHTCVVLAARGLRNLDTGNEPVTNDSEQRASIAQSRMIYVTSTIVAALVVAGFWFIW